MKRNWYLALFLLGFIFRLLLLWLYPQPVVFDAEQYVSIARKIIDYKLYTDSFRVYGYPLFLAAIITLARTVSSNYLLFLYLIQSLLDTFTAFVIFFIARKFFPPSTAKISLLLYLFNPFTAATVTVLLPEALALLLLSCLYLLFTIFFKRRNFPLVIGLGLLLGFLPQVRPVFILYTVMILAFLTLFSLKLPIKRSLKIGIVLVLFITYSLPFSYNLIGNYRYFGEIAPMDVDNLFIQNLWISLFIEKSPNTIKSFWDYPPEVRWAYAVYSTGKTSEERQAIRKLFLQEIFTEIRKNPSKFISWRFKKLWYVWEKHELFPFNNPNSQIAVTTIYWLNIGFLLTALVGLINFGKKALKSNNLDAKLFCFLSLLLFLYISFSNIFTVTGERYSLPAYFLVTLYSGVGVVLVWQYLRRKFTRVAKVS